jgi:small subunit ribosomal protein S1
VEHPREVLEEGQTVSLRVIKLDQQRRRIGLSLKRVDSAEYAEMDWQSAMRDLSDDEPRPAPDAVEDFDADLEAEGSPEPEKPPEPEEETHPAA